MGQKNKQILRWISKSILFFTGFIAFFCLFGEPTDEWYEWSDKVFGSFSGVWFVAEKIIAGAIIYYIVKLYCIIEPGAMGSEE